MKKIILILIFLIAILVTPQKAKADYIYGGPAAITEILVDKLVKNPATGTFVDNLGLADTKYTAESEVVFKIVVKNTGNERLSGIKIRDIFPSYVDFVSGSAESDWNKDTKELTFAVGDLQAGETKEYELKGKVAAKKDLPSDKSVICATNWVEAKNDTRSDTDSAGLCISNISVLPPTGPDTLAVSTIIAMGASGLWLIRKSRLA